MMKTLATILKLNPQTCRRIHIGLMVIFLFNQADAQFNFHEASPGRLNSGKKFLYTDGSLLVSKHGFIVDRNFSDFIDPVTNLYRLHDCYSMLQDQTPGYFILDTPISFNERSGWCFAGGTQSGFLFSAVCLFNHPGDLNDKKDADPGIFGGAGFHFKNGLSLSMNTDLHWQPRARQVFYIGYADSRMHIGNLLLSTGFYFMNSPFAQTVESQKKKELYSITEAVSEVLISTFKSQLK